MSADKLHAFLDVVMLDVAAYLAAMMRSNDVATEDRLEAAKELAELWEVTQRYPEDDDKSAGLLASAVRPGDDRQSCPLVQREPMIGSQVHSFGGFTAR